MQIVKRLSNGRRTQSRLGNFASALRGSELGPMDGKIFDCTPLLISGSRFDLDSIERNHFVDAVAVITGGGAVYGENAGGCESGCTSQTVRSL